MGNTALRFAPMRFGTGSTERSEPTASHGTAEKTEHSEFFMSFYVDTAHTAELCMEPMGRPKTGRAKQLSFIPTTLQARILLALTEERRAADGHVTQSDVIREVVQRGLDSLQAARSSGGT